MKSLKLDDCEIVFPDQKLLDPKEREKLISQVAEKLKGRVDSAFTFGSFARGDTHAESDIDLILIKDTDTTFIKRCEEFFDLLDIYPAIDILVYTSQEFKRLTTEPTIGFWADLNKEKQQIL